MGEAAQAVAPVLSTLAQTVLGGLVILAVLVAVGAIYILIKVQNARVADQKEMSDKLERTNFKMIDAFTKFQGTLNNLEKAEGESVTAQYALRDKVMELGNDIKYCPKRVVGG